MIENLVSVLVITYGHEKYIGQAIESILMQETDFDFELVICNDCSPDKTDVIIEEYIKSHPRRDKIRYYNHKTNLGITGNFVFGLEQCNGEFLATCEGDDFYSKSDHLQSLFNHFKANPNFGFVTSTYINYFDDSKQQNTVAKKSNYYAEDIFQNRPFHVSSSLYRKSDIDQLIMFSKEKNDDQYFIDKNIMLICAKNSEIGLIDNLSFCYRFQYGVTNIKQKKIDALVPIQKYRRQLSLIEGFDIDRNLKQILNLELEIQLLEKENYMSKICKATVIILKGIFSKNVVDRKSMLKSVIRKF